MHIRKDVAWLIGSNQGENVGVDVSQKKKKKKEREKKKKFSAVQAKTQPWHFQT